MDQDSNSSGHTKSMDETIAAIDTIALRIPLDIWAPAPMSQGVPRPHVESLYVRVTTSRGVVGWGAGTFAMGSSGVALHRGKGERFSTRADVCRFWRYSVLQNRACNQRQS